MKLLQRYFFINHKGPACRLSEWKKKEMSVFRLFIMVTMGRWNIDVYENVSKLKGTIKCQKWTNQANISRLLGLH